MITASDAGNTNETESRRSLPPSLRPWRHRKGAPRCGRIERPEKAGRRGGIAAREAVGSRPRAQIPHPDPRSKRARLHLRFRPECPTTSVPARRRVPHRIQHRMELRNRSVRFYVRQAKTLDISAISGVSQHIRAPDRVKRAPRDLPVDSRVSASIRVIFQAPSVPAVPREARSLSPFGRSRTRLASNLPPADAIAAKPSELRRRPTVARHLRSFCEAACRVVAAR